MTKLFYKDRNPKNSSLDIVETANSIIEVFEADGYTLTLRQLYYQFVSKALIENSEKSYKNLGVIITKARLTGLVSWEAIEDRNRQHNSFWYEENEFKVIKDLPRHIRFDRWERQPCYVEVWVEKEALGNVISRACDPLLVPHMACKGYLSASEAWRAGQRFESKLDEGKKCILIHLGDHDPSGVDMTRDNRERLDLFTRLPGGVEVIRLALNMDQIEEHSPPPNPAKITDSRAKEYIKKYGKTSWELDALEPQFIANLITHTIRQHIDRDLWEEIDEQEAEAEKILGRLYEKWSEIRANL